MYITDHIEGYSVRVGESLQIRIKPKSYQETVLCHILSVQDPEFLEDIDVTTKEGDYWYLDYNTIELPVGAYVFSFWGTSQTGGIEEISNVNISVTEPIRRLSS